MTFGRFFLVADLIAHTFSDRVKQIIGISIVIMLMSAFGDFLGSCLNWLLATILNIKSQKFEPTNNGL